MGQDKQGVEYTQKIRHNKSCGSKIKDFIPHSTAGSMMFMVTSPSSSSAGQDPVADVGYHTRQASIPARSPKLRKSQTYKGNC